MEKRYIDALTEICGATSVLYEMSDIERYLYDETEEYVVQRLVRTVSLFVRALMKKFLKFLNGQIKSSYRLFPEVAVQVPAVRQSLQNRLLL